MYWIWKIYIRKQFREIIYTKFREISRNVLVFEKIYITKQFREIIYTKFREISYKFREMYWYLKNLHNETISRNNLYEILQNFV
jgi:hypothetical protein